MPPANPPPQAEKMVTQERPTLQEVVIEIGDNMNRQVLFGPTQERLRGRWDSHNLQLGDTSSVGLMQMPSIPGMYVVLHPRERRGMIMDPLTLPENTALLHRVAEAHQGLFSRLCKPVEPMVREELSDDELATWLYWMMRTVQAGQARIVTGEVPDSEREIQKSFPRAKIRRDFYNSLAPSVEKAEKGA